MNSISAHYTPKWGVLMRCTATSLSWSVEKAHWSPFLTMLIQHCWYEPNDTWRTVSGPGGAVDLFNLLHTSTHAVDPAPEPRRMNIKPLSVSDKVPCFPKHTSNDLNQLDKKLRSDSRSRRAQCLSLINAPSSKVFCDWAPLYSPLFMIFEVLNRARLLWSLFRNHFSS